MVEINATYFNRDRIRVLSANEETGMERVRDYGRDHGTFIVDWSSSPVKGGTDGE